MAQHASFDRDGFLIVRGLLSAEEVKVVRGACEQDESLAGGSTNAIELNDDAGGKTDLHLWSKPGNGTLGLLTRSRRVVHTMEQLLAVTDAERGIVGSSSAAAAGGGGVGDGASAAPGAPVVHYHSKTLRKDAHSGGVWNWHQDYGYWYKDNFLMPHMATVWFAVDAATRENGCLKVLRGSHRLGRLDHWAKGDQQGADEERVTLALARHEEVFCEMAAGDACFFHALTLHSSEGNFSDQRRLAFASAFTRADNVQFRDAYIPCFPSDEVDDGALMRAGGVVVNNAEDKVMLGGDEGVKAARKTDDYASLVEKIAVEREQGD